MIFSEHSSLSKKYFLNFRTHTLTIHTESDRKTNVKKHELFPFEKTLCS